MVTNNGVRRRKDMCHDLLRNKAILHVMTIAIVLGMDGPVSALNYFWTGAVGPDAADPANWVNDGGAAMVGTLPSNDDTVRVGCTTAWQGVDMATHARLT